DDIKIEYHPSSGIKAKVHGFDSFDYRAAEFLVPPSDGQPWCPFKSRLKFEIAEIMLEVRFNNEQSDQFIKLCHHCSVGKEKFTFKNHKDIHNMWEAASHHITKVIYFISILNESDIQWLKKLSTCLRYFDCLHHCTRMDRYSQDILPWPGSTTSGLQNEPLPVGIGGHMVAL
ncbi:hypothetical protein EDB19DRAFT_1640990, partial [Suillus lakei]